VAAIFFARHAARKSKAQRKQFFFEQKNQETFAVLAYGLPAVGHVFAELCSAPS